MSANVAVAVRPVRVVLNWSFHLSLSLSLCLPSFSAGGEICAGEEGSVEIIKTGAPRRYLRGILLQLL